MYSRDGSVHCFHLQYVSKVFDVILHLVCASVGSDAVLGSNGHPLPPGWLLQRGEGRLREIQTLCSQVMSGARSRARQGLFCFSSPPLSPVSVPPSLLSDSALVQVRVGLIQFGSTPRLEFALDSHTSKQDLKKRIKAISYRCVAPFPQ